MSISKYLSLEQLPHDSENRDRLISTAPFFGDVSIHLPATTRKFNIAIETGPYMNDYVYLFKVEHGDFCRLNNQRIR